MATTAESSGEYQVRSQRRDNMALLAIEHENRHGNLDLLEELSYFDALQRLTSYVCRDMQELQDALYAAAHAMKRAGLS